MIFHDRVGVICKTKDGSGTSFPVYETFNGTVPAIVVPMSSVNIVSNGGSVTYPRYLLMLKPFDYKIPLNASSSVPSTAGANQILFTYDGYSSLSVEGKIERHLLRGRLHHYEAILRN